MTPNAATGDHFITRIDVVVISPHFNKPTKSFAFIISREFLQVYAFLLFNALYVKLTL